MKKLLYLIALTILLSGCATYGRPFEKYPAIENSKGQLVIFNQSSPEEKLNFKPQVLCNGKRCGTVINGRGEGGYTAKDYPPGKLTVSMLPDPSWALGPTIRIKANSLDVNLIENKRTVVRVELIQGSESYWGTTLSSAHHTYQIFEVPEEKAESLLKGLKQARTYE
ncbi:hypothetical protein DIC66_21430 [Rhodoferax lacus]|uniref:Uncharacterized protein n=1 Tax=Rhodoferax lacus TaxID=2184758 RepID=A0A3E1R631_9BURK|nr:hypothetical protein [Rhodoferax lacus]RFO94835.1 hypothetical protein DIC66_21430 [Rhodoferax lacus]